MWEADYTGRAVELGVSSGGLKCLQKAIQSSSPAPVGAIITAAWGWAKETTWFPHPRIPITFAFLYKLSGSFLLPKDGDRKDIWKMMNPMLESFTARIMEN